jgi:hypothetical protein
MSLQSGRRTRRTKCVIFPLVKSRLFEITSLLLCQELEKEVKSKPKKGKKPAVELSKDEETIKRLKVCLSWLSISKF